MMRRAGLYLRLDILHMEVRNIIIFMMTGKIFQNIVCASIIIWVLLFRRWYGMKELLNNSQQEDKLC